MIYIQFSYFGVVYVEISFQEFYCLVGLVVVRACSISGINEI